MPFYTYFCRECDNKFEKFLKIADYQQPIGEPCPNCSANAVDKMCDAPMTIDPTKIMGRVKLNDDFREVLKSVQKKTYKSDFNIR